MLVGLDVEPSARPRLRGRERRPVQSVQGHDRRAARQAAPLDDLGDGADPGIDALVARHEQHALLLAGVERQRHRHAWEDDGVVQWDE